MREKLVKHVESLRKHEKPSGRASLALAHAHVDLPMDPSESTCAAPSLKCRGRIGVRDEIIKFRRKEIEAGSKVVFEGDPFYSWRLKRVLK